ncbi:hypothetical protein H696_05149 [Fonticula alba]|uniref:MARVEL domain-containing protein n=1 Tax=Fonticula alba TaxID=691883 RepID=A0A058Z1R4_FONAL|nr:hypothetical protein H696_05149 [Fonticula alba]KCV68224.1 hypothetical protein H696_05149 [Fonticula alba]|eukprot:XP_009497278.1 hypothetical protein H696_05149 [Fonticula alba]
MDHHYQGFEDNAGAGSGPGDNSFPNDPNAQPVIYKQSADHHQGHHHHGDGADVAASSRVFAVVQPAQTDLKVLLRAASWFCSLVAFSAAAASPFASSHRGFFIFTGVVSWLLDMVFLGSYFRPELVAPQVLSQNWPVIEFFSLAVFSIFWFFGFTFFCVYVNALTAVGGIALSTPRAAAAFGFFSMILNFGSLFLAFSRARGLLASLLGGLGGNSGGHLAYSDL